jgi:hypothetical protein
MSNETSKRISKNMKKPLTDEDVDEDSIINKKRLRSKQEVVKSESLRRSTRQHALQEEDSDNEEDENDNEDENSGRGKYSFRNRQVVKREQLNVSELGGGGGGNASYYGKENKKNEKERESRRKTEDRLSYRDPQAGLYLGGRLPPSNLREKEKERERERRRRRHGADSNHYFHRYHGSNRNRKHYDSSSASDSESNNFWGKGNMLNDDDNFKLHENRRLQQELDSIQPLNSVSMGSSIMDNASRRDLLRADVTPVEVDSKIGFDSIGDQIVFQ